MENGTGRHAVDRVQRVVLWPEVGRLQPMEVVMMERWTDPGVVETGVDHEGIRFVVVPQVLPILERLRSPRRTHPHAIDGKFQLHEVVRPGIGVAMSGPVNGVEQPLRSQSEIAISRPRRRWVDDTQHRLDRVEQIVVCENPPRYR